MEKLTAQLEEFSKFIGENMAKIKSEIFSEGRRAGLEEAARAMCEACADSRLPAAEKFGNVWGHRCGDNYVHCYAHAIWAIRAIAQSEPPKFEPPQVGREEVPTERQNQESLSATGASEAEESGALLASGVTCPACSKPMKRGNGALYGIYQAWYGCVPCQKTVVITDLERPAHSQAVIETGKALLASEVPTDGISMTLTKQRESEMELFAELYQVAGVLFAEDLVPRLLLDKLSAAQRGVPIPQDDLLPFDIPLSRRLQARPISPVTEQGKTRWIAKCTSDSCTWSEICREGQCESDADHRLLKHVSEHHPKGGNGHVLRVEISVHPPTAEGNRPDNAAKLPLCPAHGLYCHCLDKAADGNAAQWRDIAFSVYLTANAENRTMEQRIEAIAEYMSSKAKITSTTGATAAN